MTIVTVLTDDSNETNETMNDMIGDGSDAIDNKRTNGNFDEIKIRKEETSDDDARYDDDLNN